MPSEYKHNHYVPQWYQKKFIPNNQIDKELYYMKLKPNEFTDSRGYHHIDRAVRKLGFNYCFAEDDLYTTTYGFTNSTDVEKIFFGNIDRLGNKAVDFFANFSYSGVRNYYVNDLLLYMSTQKLRTPKGLQWLSNQTKNDDKTKILSLLIDYRNLYEAVWTECVWLIADADQSETKFIISDHPVTIYNRRLGPNSDLCKGFNDPDIRFHASHTIFPLTLDRILMLTNLSWVRNPYQNPVKYRPNPSYFRNTIFKFLDIQTQRHLSEQEVREINFVIKKRAYKYIGAAKEEWLYPEKYVSISNWNTYDNGYLFMPDPRSTSFSGEVIIGYKDGSSTAFDEYGYRPWQNEFGKTRNENKEFETFHRFQGEYARLFGPFRRGRSSQMGQMDPEKDDEKYHQYHLDLERKNKHYKR